MPDRYFVDVPIEGDHARLDGPEAHHLAHVLRGKIGDEVTLFDGSGAQFEARVKSIGRSSVELAVISRREVNRELARRVTLTVSLPKGDRQRWLVEKATELGVARLVPLLTSRGVAQPGDAALIRLRRAVIEASKQCGRNTLMEIAQPIECGELVASAAGSGVRWIAHPLSPSGRGHWPVVSPSTSELWCAVGPEGGFTDDEVGAALRFGWHPIDLGPRILRVETAAIALAALASLTQTEEDPP
jgi:16S rRNA (uracil1498-N3)-methyltransferase